MGFDAHVGVVTVTLSSEDMGVAVFDGTVGVVVASGGSVGVVKMVSNGQLELSVKKVTSAM